jgi:hypothetical protein
MEVFKSWRPALLNIFKCVWRMSLFSFFQFVTKQIDAMQCSLYTYIAAPVLSVVHSTALCIRCSCATGASSYVRFMDV